MTTGYIFKKDKKKYSVQLIKLILFLMININKTKISISKFARSKSNIVEGLKIHKKNKKYSKVLVGLIILCIKKIDKKINKYGK